MILERLKLDINFKKREGRGNKPAFDLPWVCFQKSTSNYIACCYEKSGCYFPSRSLWRSFLHLDVL